MRVTQELLNRHSEDAFSHKLMVYSDSGASVIHVRTDEVVRATLALRKTVLVEANQYREWDIINGFREFDANTMFKTNVEGDGQLVFNSAILEPMKDLVKKKPESSDDDEQLHFFVYVNPLYWLEEPAVVHMIQQYAHVLPPSNIRVVFVTPNVPMPETVSSSIVTLYFDTPGHKELKKALGAVLDGVDDSILNVDKDDYDKICFAGAGMTKEGFEMFSSLAIVQNAVEDSDEAVGPDEIIEGLNKGKTEIVNKNDLLELYHTEDMDDVGGMELLKAWVEKRKNCYTEEAAEFGIEAPKGMVFVGPPGTGKSLVAKAVAATLGVPCIRLDFGKVFQSLVGASEERIRTALRMVEAMAPCVLFCDEIDKGLGGMGGSGDSGTGSRVLGTFLTWLQDNKTPVFTMVTANNIDGLPPELLRRGRFDEIFATRLPAGDERQQILEIHLRKRGYDIADFSKKDYAKFVGASKAYVGAEIETSLKDALINAFDADEELEMHHIVASLKEMTPLSKAYGYQIQMMTLWARENARPASKVYDDDFQDATVEPKKGARVRVHHRRGSPGEQVH